MLATDPATQNIWHYVSALLQLAQPLRSLDLPCDDVQGTRYRIRAKLKETHEYLGTLLNERDAYFVLFALVAHIDEIAQVHVQHVQSAQGWEPLQYELFGLTEAGELFYGYSDSFRGRNDIPEIIFEIYFFCINDGFKGRYITDQVSLDHYRKELSAYIQPLPIARNIPREEALTRHPFRPRTWMYYAALALFFVLLNAFLSALPLNISTTI